MLVNQIVPVEMKERICVHCNKTSPEEDPMTYLIAGPRQGKSTETIRQAVFRRDVILSTEYDFFKSAGMKHASQASPGEVCHLGLRDIFSNEHKKISQSPEMEHHRQQTQSSEHHTSLWCRHLSHQLSL